MFASEELERDARADEVSGVAEGECTIQCPPRLMEGDKKARQEPGLSCNDPGREIAMFAWEAIRT